MINLLNTTPNIVPEQNNKNKRLKIIGFAMFVVVGIVSWIILISMMRGTDNKSSTNIQTTYKSIIPGKTTKEEVLDIMGKPLSEKQEGEYLVLTFKSDIEPRPHIVKLKDNIVDIFIEAVLMNKSPMQVFDSYGEAPNKLYAHFVKGSRTLFIYPEDGIAFMGYDGNSVDMLEMWYFKPMPFEEFRKLYTPNYYDKTADTPEEFPKDYVR